jgi:hypothetical protein
MVSDTILPFALTSIQGPTCREAPIPLIPAFSPRRRRPTHVKKDPKTNSQHPDELQ